MDVLPSMHQMVRMARAGAPLDVGMRRLIAMCGELIPDADFEGLKAMDWNSDLASLEAWMEDLLVTEPPPKDTNAFWFGLFEGQDEDGPSCFLYVAGSNKHKKGEDAADWPVGPTWFPELRYADSQCLRDLYRATRPEDAGEDVAELGEMILCLGYACLVISHLCRKFAPQLADGTVRFAACGWDSGDILPLGEVSAQGFKGRPQDELWGL